MPTLRRENCAFGAPGISPRWTAARKEAVGTAYSTASRIWFTLWRGILTEVYYPTVDRPQIRDLQFLITDGETFFHEEKRELDPEVHELPECLGYSIINRDRNKLYRLEKTVIADPHLPCVLMRTKLICASHLAEQLKLYALCAPHVGGSGHGNNAHVMHVGGRNILVANKGNTWLALGATVPFSRTSCGYVGHSDGWTDISQNRQMDWEFDCALNGNVALTGELTGCANQEFTLGLAFGHGGHSAISTLLQSLSTPFERQLDRFGSQWKRTARARHALHQVSFDHGRLFEASYKILMAHEDKLNPGALIASLSIPWGEAKGDEDLGGYHLVWPRDMVNSASGLLAAGNLETAQRALIFLAASQRDDGSFPQNFWINGDPYWQGLQLDEVSFPILLAWRLQKCSGLDGFNPYAMVKLAARFLILNGPVTQQERWEEVGGYSPSTLAANIASLICAASFARMHGEDSTAAFLEDYADYLRCHIEEWTVTTTGRLHPDVARHFVRINPIKNANEHFHPDDAQVPIANRPPGTQNVFEARDIVDGGFLELVRYGVYAADDPLVVDSVKVIDHVLKTETPKGPVWHRYNNAPTRQQADGSPFISWGVGRGWPLLTGERGHYELACGRDAALFIQSMERFASPTGPIPEQVWDTDDLPEMHLLKGCPTGSAMPLAWAHAEYIKLLRSTADKRVYDLIAEVYERYVVGNAVCRLIEIWHLNWQVPTVRPGHVLRIQSDRKFRLHWTLDAWTHTQETNSIGTTFGIDYVDVEVGIAENSAVQFTFYWFNTHSWEGKDFQVKVVRGRCE